MILDMLIGSNRRKMSGGDLWTDIGYGTGPLSNFWYSLMAKPTKSGVAVNHDVAMTYSAVWVATLRRIGVMSQLPKNLYRKLPGKRTEIAVDRPEHWLLHSTPNPLMTTATFHNLMEEWRLNGGNAYADIQWGWTGTVRHAIAMWPIHPSRVTPKMVNGELWYEVKNNNADPTWIAQRDMIHLTSVMPIDGIVGSGVVTQARESIGFGLSTEQHGADIVGSGGLPNIALEQEQVVLKDDTQRSLFRKEWREIHGGGQNTPAILPPGMKIKTLTFSMEDLQFLTLRQHNIEEMARWYDLPPHTLHHLLRMTNNNVEQLSIDIVRFSFIPWIVPNEQEYLRKLMPDEEERKGYFFRYEVNGLLRGDSASRSALYHNGIVDGWLSPNEVRELEDWNPYDGGDQYFIQGAMMPVDQVGMQQTEQALLPPPNNAKEESLKACARAMLTAAINRMVERESLAMRRWATQKPNKFIEAADAFYADHRAIVADAIGPVCIACAGFGAVIDAEQESREMCDTAKAEILRMTDTAKADTLAADVESLVAEWSRTRAASMIAKIAELN